jgi:AcrR family transcriptional regulator
MRRPLSIPDRWGDKKMPKETSLFDAHWKAFADRRRDPDGKREAILRTAVQLFLDRSYGRTSLNDIAEKLNITKPALYHYFRNKDEILLECYRWGCMLIRDLLDDIAGQGGTGIEKVRAFIYAYTSLITIDFGRAVIRLDDGELSTEARAEVRSYKREIDRRLRSFVQEGIDDGSITACDPKLAAFAIAGSINWISTWYVPRGALSPEQIASSFAQTLTAGLAAKTDTSLSLVRARTSRAASKKSSLRR